MDNITTIDPNDNLKLDNVSKNLALIDQSIPALINNLLENIDDLKDIQSSEFKFKEYPDTENIEEFLSIIIGDLKSGRKALVDIPNIINSEYNSSILGIAHINKDIAKLQNTLLNIQSASTTRGMVNKRFITENITNEDSFDKEFPKSAPLAFVDLELGALTLAKTSVDNVKNPSMRVFKSNKNQVRDILAESPVNFFYEGRYYGYADESRPEGGDFKLAIRKNPTKLVSMVATDEDKNKARVAVFDGKIDTSWMCEYVQAADKIDTTPLQVHILIDLGSVISLSNIKITPFQVNQGDVLDVVGIFSGADTATFKPLEVFRNLLVEDPNQRAKSDTIATSGAFNGNYSNQIDMSFESITARYILVILSQQNVAKITYPKLKVNISRQNPATNEQETKTVVLDYLQSLALSTPYGSNVELNDLLKAVFGIGGGWSINEGSLAPTYLTDRAHQAIGISEIQIGSTSYSETSEITSKGYDVSNTDVSSISLSSDDVVPDFYPKDTDWIEYYITLDGNTFTRIAPKGSGRGSSNIPTSIKITEAITDLRVKIIIKRPVGAVNTTPVVKGYQLHIQKES